MPPARLLRSLSTMASIETVLAPPPAVRGMRILDRAAFRREARVPAIRLQHPGLCARFLERFKQTALRYPGVKKFVDGKDADGRPVKVLLLSPEECQEKPLSQEDVEWITANGGERLTHSMVLEYPHFTKHAVLRAILPLDVTEVPTSFEAVGHIAHLNLREECLPYKEVIGEVILDKQQNIRTVVNKTDSIDNTFRFFKMELLAGDDDMEVTLRENGCSFKFDFSKVYWNSRLHTEHERVVHMLRKGDVVLDVFAGVGPFALPACKRGCEVHANDLNPHSYSALCENAKLNRVTKSLHAYNMDARDFIRSVSRDLVHRFLEQQRDEDVSQLASRDRRAIVSHFLMNLPASAVEFLNALEGIFSELPEPLRAGVKLPVVHCYCFSKSLEPEKDALAMVEEKLGESLGGDSLVFRVREVAPNKSMLRVSFELPRAVAYCKASQQGGDASAEEPSPKRSRLQ